MWVLSISYLSAHSNGFPTQFQYSSNSYATLHNLPHPPPLRSNLPHSFLFQPPYCLDNLHIFMTICCSLCLPGSSPDIHMALSLQVSLQTSLDKRGLSWATLLRRVSTPEPPLSLFLTLFSPQKVRILHTMYFQFSSATQSCPTLWDPMDYSRPGFPVHPQLPGLAQTNVHWVSDVIQPSHPLSFPSPPAFNLSQHQGLSQWVSSSHQVAKVLEFQL